MLQNINGMIKYQFGIDSKKIRELMKKRDAIMQDPLDLLIKSVRES